MAISIKKDGRVYVRYWDKEKGKTKDKYFGKGLDAKNKAIEFNSSLKLRTYDQGAKLSPYFIELLNAYTKAKASEFPVDSMKNLLWKMEGVIIPTLGGPEVRALEINANRLDDYVTKRIKHVKRITIHRELSDVRAILNWAVARKHITHNPMIGFQMPTKEKKEMIAPTKAEIDAIIAHAKPHLVRAVCISYFTGARPGLEMLNITWEKLDCCNKTLTVLSSKKTAYVYRTIPLQDEIFYLLLSWYHEDIDKGLPDNMAIVNYRGKGVRSVKKSLATARRLSGVTRNINPYALRHAFATAILKAGGNLKATSQLLGHSRPDTTMKFYQHTDDEMSKDAISLLPGLNVPLNRNKKSPRAA